jgi:N-acetylglucosaminyldiphosphoundecaprenol N-acetyl-beta-D-mannosaminyltransferase
MGTLPMPRTAALFGLNLSCMTYLETLDWLEQEILRRPPARACVFSANVDQLIRHRNDPAFRKTYELADLVVPDGMPVVWSSRLAGRPVAERVTGIDLMLGLCQRASVGGYRCFLLGSQPEICTQAAEVLQQNLAGLLVCGCHHGYFRDDGPVVEEINLAATDILFVGMGSPRQESWLQSNFSRLRCRVAVPVGGAFEVLAGRRRRAPALLQKSGMEWAWRMLQEPGRLGRRYLIEDLRFLPMALGEIRARRGRAGQA